MYANSGKAWSRCSNDVFVFLTICFSFSTLLVSASLWRLASFSLAAGRLFPYHRRADLWQPQHRSHAHITAGGSTRHFTGWPHWDHMRQGSQSQRKKKRMREYKAQHITITALTMTVYLPDMAGAGGGRCLPFQQWGYIIIVSQTVTWEGLQKDDSSSTI